MPPVCTNRRTFQRPVRKKALNPLKPWMRNPTESASQNASVASLLLA
jgi:hypothetical protein